MKFNIKKNGIYSFAFATAVSLTACTGDLNVTPIDPNLDTPENVLSNPEAYNQVLAKCYSGLAVSSPDGDSGDPDIEGIDGGFGQYLRALFNLQELPTDEAVIGWNDQTLKDLHGLQWTASDVFVSACYSRVFYQISLCNEIIRQIDAAGSNDATLQQYRAEARAIRGLSYLHAIDMFGNVPFTDENSVVGGDNPTQMSRTELFNWMVKDMEETAEILPANPEKYRAGKGMAYMILAKLYLNAAVYTGTANYPKCAEYCQKIIDLGYQLEEGGHHTSGTTYIINAQVGGKMSYADYGLGGNGWGGIRVTPQFVDKFESGDQRAKFFTTGQSKEIVDISDFASGYAFTKFTNLKADGTMIDGANSFPDTDFPVFRLGDVYLMLAECEVVGGVSCDGIAKFNEIRTRAGVNPIASPTKANILDERARELAWECHRRSDLVRFGFLTSGDYLWAHKGMNSNVGTPHGVDSKYNLYPLASSDVISNTNLTQNAGY